MLCFLRYYTLRRRFFVPSILYEGGGSHQLQVPDGHPGGDDEEITAVANSDSDGDLGEIGCVRNGPSAADAIVHDVPLVSPELHLLTTKFYS